jgi:small subunit ribosomal protein S1
MNKVQSSGGSSFAELLNEEFFERESVEGKVVVGTIVDIKNDRAIVDVGLKAEGRLLLCDIRAVKGSDEVSIGDKIDVFVERAEDRNGEPVLSIEKAKLEAAWQRLEEHLAAGTVVDGVIIGKTKGGYTVDISGTIAFLPGSQVDLRSVKDITPYLNTTYQFKILKMDKARNNIVVSRRTVLEIMRNEAKAEVISKLEEGMVINGTVKNITDYGAFVDIGGVDGLLHVTDMSWKRVTNPGELLSVGEQVRVQVTKFSKETGRISLGMKQLQKSPWEGIEERYVVGNKYKGKIVNVTDYGAFVELEDCLEGMVYETELSWIKKNMHPSKIVSPGDEVEVMVLEVNTIKKKIGLGIKQCQENPWQKFADENPVGTIISGVIKNITEFGIFVSVNDILDGMVHVSDISWSTETNEYKSKDLQIGQTVNVAVLSVNPEKERISLGMKQLEKDPYAEAASTVKKGDIVVATVTGIQSNLVDVTLDNGLPGVIKRADISTDKEKQRTDTLSVGEKVEGLVLSIDASTHRVSLTIKGLDIKREREALEKFGATDGGASLGDILGDAIKQIDERS